MLTLSTKRQANALLGFQTDRMETAINAISDAIRDQSPGWRAAIRDALIPLSTAHSDLVAFTPQFVDRFDHD